MEDQPTGSTPPAPGSTPPAPGSPPPAPGSAAPGAGLPPLASGPLDRSTAIDLLGRADALFENGEYPNAGAIYQRVVGFDDPAITGAALYGPGAAGGVLLIRTKRGRSGPPQWEAYAAGGVRSESAFWPANFGGVDVDSPDSVYRLGGCTLAAQAAGSCVQDFVQQFSPLAQRSPFRTALGRQYGLSVWGGSRRADYRLAGDFSGSDGPYSSRVVTPDPNYYRRLNFRGSGAVRPWPELEVSASVARITPSARPRCSHPAIAATSAGGRSSRAGTLRASSGRPASSQHVGRRWRGFRSMALSGGTPSGWKAPRRIPRHQWDRDP